MITVAHRLHTVADSDRVVVSILNFCISLQKLKCLKINSMGTLGKYYFLEHVEISLGNLIVVKKFNDLNHKTY